MNEFSDEKDGLINDSDFDECGETGDEPFSADRNSCIRWPLFLQQLRRSRPRRRSKLCRICVQCRDAWLSCTACRHRVSLCKIPCFNTYQTM